MMYLTMYSLDVLFFPQFVTSPLFHVWFFNPWDLSDILLFHCILSPISLYWNFLSLSLSNWCIFVLPISTKVSFPQMSKPRFSLFFFLILIDWFSWAWSQVQHEGFFIFVVACGIFSCSMWDLVPSKGMKPRPCALGAWSLSHWTTEKVPDFPFLTSYYIQSILL